MAEPSSHPNFAFRDGRLWITDTHTTLWLRAWPDPEAQGTTPLGAWAPMRPSFRLVQPEPLESSAAREFTATFARNQTKLFRLAEPRKP